MAKMLQKLSEQMYSLFLWLFLLCKLPEVVCNNYIRPLPDGFPVGSAIVIRGIPILTDDEQTFVINLLPSSPLENKDEIDFHISFRCGVPKVAFNNFIAGNGGWQHEILTTDLPVHYKKPFKIMILSEPSYFSVYVDGNHYFDFGYRQPLERIKYLEVAENVHVSLITVDVASGHTWPLPNGFPIGSRILITGIPRAHAPESEKVFSLNFLTYSPFGSTGDIACQITARYEEGNITSNNFVHNKGWQKEQLYRDTPIQSGRPFKFIIQSEASYFSVFVNNSHILDFIHPVPVEKIKFFQIRGNVDISSITIDKKPLDFLLKENY